MRFTVPRVSDVERKTREACGFLDTNPASQRYRDAKRARIIIIKLE